MHYVRGEKQKTKRKLAWAMGLFLIVLAVMVMIANLNRPNQGVLKATPPADISAKPRANKQLEHSGKYFKFLYPASFTLIPDDKLAGIELEKATLVRRILPYWNLNFSLSRLASNSLDDYAPYYTRATTPGRYQPQNFKIAGQNLIVYSDQTTYDKAAFIAHNGMVLSVDLNSIDTAHSSEQDKILTGVLQSIEWLN